MPEGIVYREEGPDSQQKIGQITSSNGDILSFFNVENLKEGEPVIFDVIRTKLVLKAEINGVKYKYKGKVPIALIPKDLQIDEKDHKKKWPKEFRDRWESEWEKYSSDQDIEQKLGVKLRRSVKKHPHCQ
jgi:hypothetical protein